MRIIILLLLSVCLMAGTAWAQTAATLTSDKADYAPTEVAELVGTGFLPGEFIDLSITIFDPVTGLHIADFDWTVENADDAGGFVTYYTIPYEAVDMTLIATAMGYTSGRVATVTFTDAPAVHQVNFATSGLPAGVSLSITGTKYNPNNGNLGGFTANFTSPGPSDNQGAMPGMPVTYAGFPASVDVGADTYDLDTVLPVSGFTAGAAGSATTVTATYVKRITTPAPTNAAPTLSASDYHLGQVVGCLVDGAFQTTFTVVGNLSVFAPVTGDPDGDPVTLTANVDSVTLVGPGLAEASVTLTATDDPSARNVAGYPALTPLSTSVTVKVTAQVVYDFSGFLPPLGKGATTSVKNGSTVPVKFQLFDCDGTAITTGVHAIGVLRVSATAPNGDPTVDDSGNSGDNGILFRYADPNWIFNLRTGAALGYEGNCTYKIVATLDDGTTHEVMISIKR